MLHPNYVELMNVVNKDVEEGEAPVINSRYSIVMAAAKRARQLVSGADPLVETDEKEKPLSIAVDELWKDRIQILGEDTDTDEAPQLAIARTGVSVTGVEFDQDDEEIAADPDAMAEINLTERYDNNSQAAEVPADIDTTDFDKESDDL